MVVVKVRETYDLATVKNKMTVISVHTPKPDIIKRNYPGLLMQCKAYRPLKAHVALACASVLPLDPLGVGTTEDAVAPEDMFNPILYKAMTNIGLSQLEARILALSTENISSGSPDVAGDTAIVDTDSVTSYADEFNIYYGLLSNAHGWKHASPQQGLSMTNLKPLVYEILYNAGDQGAPVIAGTESLPFPDASGNRDSRYLMSIRGNAKPLPFVNCVSYSVSAGSGTVAPGFGDISVRNAEFDVPYINCCVAGLVIPPSKLHQLFYRMVVTWEIEFTGIRPIGEITNYVGLNALGGASHFQNYDYASAKKAITGTEKTILENDTCMVSANVDVSKVM